LRISKRSFTRLASPPDPISAIFSPWRTTAPSFTRMVLAWA